MNAIFGIFYWPAVGALIAAAGAILLIGYLNRHRSKPGARWFMLALGAQTIWCGAYGIGLFVADPTIRLALEAIMWFGMIWTGPLFLAFGFEYTGRRDLARAWSLFPFLFLSLVGTIALLTTGRHELVFVGYEVIPVAGLSVAAYSIGPIGYLTVGSGVVSAAIGVLLLVETISDYGPLYRREATAVALSPVAPSVGILLWLFEIGPEPALHLAPALFVPHFIFDAYAFVGTDMFESNPTTRRAAERNAIENLPTPVLTLDSNGQIVDCNERAEAIFAADEGTLLGMSLDAVLDDEWISPVASDGDHSLIAIRLDGERRIYRRLSVSLTDPTGLDVGTTVVFQDITQAQRREQRLDVLNRILRHNLRNGMAAISGNADLIRERTDDETIAELADSISESGGRMMSVADKARAFDDLREAALSTRTVDLGSLLTELVDRHSSEFPDATIDVSISEPLTVRSNPRLLRLLFSNLVENALEHAGDAPIELTATVLEDGVHIEVRDNGDGIPPGELEPLRSGEETPLQHGSGIGLWIVHWSAETLGCRLDFDTSDGTTVTVTIPVSEGT